MTEGAGGANGWIYSAVLWKKRLGGAEITRLQYV